MNKEKKEVKRDTHLIDMMLNQQEVKSEKSSLSDVDLNELKNKQRTLKLLKDLENWHAETKELKEEIDKRDAEK